MRMVFLSIRAITFAAGFIYLWAWAAWSVRRLDHNMKLAFPEWLAGVSVILMASGALLAAACVAAFVAKGRGTPAPFDPPQRFVAAGPYRWVRNPMYIGGIAMLAGFGLYEGSPSILALAAAAFLIAHLMVVLYEERTLAANFGSEYQEYCGRVPRWIPRRP